jgi:hypothetical protein
MQAGQQEVVDGGSPVSLGGKGCGLRGVQDKVMKPVTGAVLASAGDKMHGAGGGLTQLAH